MKSDNALPRPIELLAPAKNLECGIEAINHGADAVYIGAPRFGARAAAGNSLEDIARLVRYAHLFGARIYVTVNTILRDEELEDTERMIGELYRIGVDALIVQDMGITKAKEQHQFQNHGRLLFFPFALGKYPHADHQKSKSQEKAYRGKRFEGLSPAVLPVTAA